MRLSKGVPGHTFNPFDEFPGTATLRHQGMPTPAMAVPHFTH